MVQSPKRILWFFVTVAAALAIPLCIHALGWALVSRMESSDHSSGWRAWSYGLYLLFLLTLRMTSVVAGFAVVVRALRPRWVMLTLVAVAYFPFMFAVLELYAWMWSPILTSMNCSPGGCWA